MESSASDPSTNFSTRYQLVACAVSATSTNVRVNGVVPPPSASSPPCSLPPMSACVTVGALAFARRYRRLPRANENRAVEVRFRGSYTSNRIWSPACRVRNPTPPPSTATRRQVSSSASNLVLTSVVDPAPDTSPSARFGIRRSVRAPGPQFSFTRVRIMDSEPVAVITRHVPAGCDAHADAGAGQVTYPATRARSSAKLMDTTPGGACSPPESPPPNPISISEGISIRPAVQICPSRITTRRWPGWSCASTSGHAGSVTVPDAGSLNRRVTSRFVQPSIGSPTTFRAWSVTSRLIAIRRSRIGRCTTGRPRSRSRRRRAGTSPR